MGRKLQKLEMGGLEMEEGFLLTCNGLRKKEIGMQEHKMEEMTDLKWVLKVLNLAATVI